MATPVSLSSLRSVNASERIEVIEGLGPCFAFAAIGSVFAGPGV